MYKSMSHDGKDVQGMDTLLECDHTSACEDFEDVAGADDGLRVTEREYMQFQMKRDSDSEVGDVGSDDATSVSRRSDTSAMSSAGNIDDSTLDALCSDRLPSVVFDNNDSVEDRNGAYEDGEGVNADEDIGEPSSEACSEEFRRNVHDPTFDSEDSDALDVREPTSVRVEDGRVMWNKETEDAPLFGVRGPKSVSVLDPVDCNQLIRIARDIHTNNCSHHAMRWRFCENLRQEADFVPAGVFAVLARVFDDWQQLSRVLQLDWVGTWSGWTDARRNIASCTDDELMKFLCEDVVKEFCNLCIHDVVRQDFMTDMQRRQQLVDLGYKIGIGDGHNCNCLIDSMLQLLVHHKVVKGPPSRLPFHLWRSGLCEMTRSRLCKHDNIGLRPRLRDEKYKEIQATEEQHARAFLEHHKHGEVFLKVLIELAKLNDESFERTIRIIVFSRFDGTIVNPHDDPVVFDFKQDSDMPVLDMFLYNTTGDSHTGLHYDPVTVCEVKPGRNGKEDEENGDATLGVKRSGRRRLRKTGAPNPHDEQPVFLKIKSRCTDSCCDDSTRAATDKVDIAGNARQSSSIEDASPEKVSSELEVDEKDKEPFLYCLSYEWCRFT